MFSRLAQLNQLRGFEAAARLGSFKAAADELNVSPTAISHQISALEEALGVSLFERRTRAVVLTEQGAKLAQSVHQVFLQLSATIEEVCSAQSVLRIGTTTSFASMWLVPNLAQFHALYPNIQVEIKTGEELIEINRDRRIDLVIRYGEIKENADSKIKLVTESVGAYATRDYLRQINNVSEATLIETTWKNSNLPSISWAQWQQQFYPSLVVSKRIQFDQEQHAIQAALAGQGVVFTSSVLVEMAVNNGWLVPVKEKSVLPGLTYYLKLSPHSRELRKVDLFTRWIQTAFDT